MPQHGINGLAVPLSVIRILLAWFLASVVTSLSSYTWVITGMGGRFGSQWQHLVLTVLVMTILSEGAIRHYHRKPLLPFLPLLLIEIAAIWLFAWLAWGRVGLWNGLSVRLDGALIPRLGTAGYECAVGGFLLFGLAGSVIMLRSRETKPGYCPSCGYDLRGTRGRRCPECGALPNVHHTHAQTSSTVHE